MNKKIHISYIIFIKLLVIFLFFVYSCNNNGLPDNVFVGAVIETVNGDTQASISIFTNLLNIDSGVSGAIVKVNDTLLYPFFIPGVYMASLSSLVAEGDKVNITIEFTDEERDGTIVYASEIMPAAPDIISPVQDTYFDSNEEITLEWDTVVPNPDSIQVSVGPLDTITEDEYSGPVLSGDTTTDSIPPDILKPGMSFWNIDINVSSINSSAISGDLIEYGSAVEVKNTAFVGIYTNSTEL